MKQHALGTRPQIAAAPNRPPRFRSSTAHGPAAAAVRAAALRALRVAMSGAGLALAAIAVTVGALTFAAHASRAWVQHGREVARVARTSLSLVLDEQARLRGSRLTNAPIEAETETHRRLLASLDVLVSETSDNPAQQARARAVRDAVTRWDREYRVPLVSGPAAPAASARAHELLGSALVDEIESRIGQFLDAEETLYAERVRRETAIRWGGLAVVLLETLTLAGLVAYGGRVARARTGTVFDQQEELEAQAVAREEQAARLEEQAAELEIQAEEAGEANVALSQALEEGQRRLFDVAASEARFRSVVEAATDAIITTDSEGRIRFWNAGAAHVYGYAPTEIVGAPLARLIPAQRRDAFAAELAQLMSNDPSPLTTRVVVRDALHKDGHTFPVELTRSRWEASGELFLTSIVRDVSERTEMESRLAHQATHDALTGLANRAYFRECVAEALVHDADHRERVVVLFLDIDAFKSINDMAGHDAGDQLLMAFAERLRHAARDADVVARLGGDEFGVLLRDIDADADAERIAARIVNGARQPLAITEREVVVGVSIGLARGAPDVDADALVRNADTAMYAAKEAGAGTWQWFAVAMHAAAVERARLHADLGTALERGEFRLAFQPIVSLDDARPVGVEALVRWTHPERGPLSPAAFIPAAEASGHIVPLGCWVLEEACRAVRDLPGAPYVSVNLSARQLSDDALVGDVAAALHETDLPPERLVLEITESVLMSDTAATLARLGELKALGVRVAIDDFGTGYSSLRYLQRFPVDVLKIDRSFVDSIDVDDHDAALARTIVALGDMLGLSTVAEGIERESQRALLRALGCGLGQGYHFARPMDLAAVTAWVAAAAGS